MDYLNNLFLGEEIKEDVKKYFDNIETDDKALLIYKLIIKYINISYLEDFIKIASPVINSYEFKRRIDFKHHGEESVVEHSIKVAALCYKLSINRNINTSNVVLASLMHDLYSCSWQGVKNTAGFFHAHGFVHARISLENCKNYYPELMNEKIEDAILRHMFPLNIKRPKYIEGWLIVLCDKYVSMSIFKDIKRLPSYVGITIKGK